jgi:DNA segregation ATPase FtsK/SpoIIIE-like protein
LFRALANPVPPENLADYNRQAAQHNLPPLPYALLLGDEANSFFDEKGLADELADIARRGRKWGLMMALAAHSWREKDVSRTLSALLPTRVCFKVGDDTTGTVILNSKMAGKQAMTFSHPGRGYLVLSGHRQIFQSYHLPAETLRELLAQAAQGQSPTPLNPVEVALVQYALEQLGGAFTVNKLDKAVQAGKVPGVGAEFKYHRIQALAEEFAQKGWITKPKHATDSRKVTPELAKLAGLGIQGL